MKVAAFDYELPPERIAQEPAADREEARLLVVAPDGSLEHRTIADFCRAGAAGCAAVW